MSNKIRKARRLAEIALGALLVLSTAWMYTQGGTPESEEGVLHEFTDGAVLGVLTLSFCYFSTVLVAHTIRTVTGLTHSRREHSGNEEPPTDGQQADGHPTDH